VDAPVGEAQSPVGVEFVVHDFFRILGCEVVSVCYGEYDGFGGILEEDDTRSAAGLYRSAEGVGGEAGGGDIASMKNGFSETWA